MPGLDVIRFCAAFMVMSFHLCWLQWMNKGYKGFVTNRIPGGIPFPELSWSTSFGWVGVEIFFVLSGFVIAFSAERSTPFGFAKSRMLRLYPAAWICASMTAATALSLNLGSPRELLHPWLASITLYPISPWIDGVYWTLGVEMSFYTVIFLLLAFRRFHLLEAVTLIVGSVSSAYWILGALFVDHFIFAHPTSTALRLLLIRHGCFFAVGTLAYVISRRGISPARLVAMALFVSAGIVEIWYVTRKYNQELSVNESAFVPELVFVLAILLVFVSVRAPLSQKSRFARSIRTIGLMTYPLYLFHENIGSAIMLLVAEYGGSRWLALAVAMALCVAGSLVIAIVIEPPIRAMLRKCLSPNFNFPISVTKFRVARALKSESQ